MAPGIDELMSKFSKELAGKLLLERCHSEITVESNIGILSLT
jgi:hypothetical protein